MNSRIIIIVATLVSVLVVAVIVVATTLSNRTAERTAPNAEVMLNPAVNLTNEEGARVTMTDFSERPSAWFFGFTNCPDVCPTALAEMTGYLDALGDDADKIDMVFVSVDPERDTPDVMARYMTAFDPRITGLTGSLDEVREVSEAFFVFFEKVPIAGGDYTMNHSAGIILRTADGRFFGRLDPADDQHAQLRKLRSLM
ncbi:MAG: SCO family protein [Bauldia sp.]